MKSLLLLFLFASALVAQWSNDPTVNTPVVVAADDQEEIYCSSDGEGGVIIVWADQRNGGINNRDIYAQKFDKYGNPKWDINGEAICTSNGTQLAPVCIHDGEGGAIIFWRDSRVSNTSDIYAQRIDSTGNIKWAVDGVAICTAAGVQSSLRIISDSNNNAILVWEDSRNDIGDIFVQKINLDGITQWSADGLPVCATVNRQLEPGILPDGTGGTIVVWDDRRGIDDDIYAQKIDADGNMIWDANGVLVCDANGDQFFNQACSDGNGGAIVTWEDNRNDPTFTDVYAQRINSSGNTMWGPDDVEVCAEIWDQSSPKIVTDNSGGAIIVWEDWRSDVVIEYYSQRINYTGVTLWATNGIPITNQPVDVDNHSLISDGNDGAILTWQDGSTGSENIFAQKISSSGTKQWGLDGITISSANSRQEIPFIVSDTRGGAIICWEDARNSGGDDIYAQQVSANGNLGEVISGVELESNNPDNYTLYQNYPNPFNPNTKIRFTISELRLTTLKVYDILGNELATLVNEEKPAGSYEIEFDASMLSSGIYVYKLQSGSFVDTKKMVVIK